MALTYEKVFEDVKKSLMKADTTVLEKDFAIQCNIQDEAAGAFYVAFKEGVLSVEPYDYKDCDAQLTANGDTFMKMFSKKLSGLEAHDKGLLGFEGDLEAVLALGGLEPKKTATASKKKGVSKNK
ncbi:MAG: SCP2 sterol-binding domain-containing protein [Oscillospiraceae bacterium]|nr:SCP2 sterol-binding domain-containing protein [Oscillospiraceae bacterium]